MYKKHVYNADIVTDFSRKTVVVGHERTLPQFGPDGENRTLPFSRSLQTETEQQVFERLEDVENELAKTYLSKPYLNVPIRLKER